MGTGVVSLTERRLTEQVLAWKQLWSATVKPPRENAQLDKHRCRRIRPARQAGPLDRNDRAAASASRKVGQNHLPRPTTFLANDVKQVGGSSWGPATLQLPRSFGAGAGQHSGRQRPPWKADAAVTLMPSLRGPPTPVPFLSDLFAASWRRFRFHPTHVRDLSDSHQWLLTAHQKLLAVRVASCNVRARPSVEGSRPSRSDSSKVPPPPIQLRAASKSCHRACQDPAKDSGDGTQPSSITFDHLHRQSPSRSVHLAEIHRWPQTRPAMCPADRSATDRWCPSTDRGSAGKAGSVTCAGISRCRRRGAQSVPHTLTEQGAPTAVPGDDDLRPGPKSAGSIRAPARSSTNGCRRPGRFHQGGAFVPTLPKQHGDPDMCLTFASAAFVVGGVNSVPSGGRTLHRPGHLSAVDLRRGPGRWAGLRGQLESILQLVAGLLSEAAHQPVPNDHARQHGEHLYRGWHRKQQPHSPIMKRPNQSNITVAP